MNTFEINIKDETFRIMLNSVHKSCFNVFNYSTFHIITKKSPGDWQVVEHRFGKEDIPLGKIGEAIERHLGNLLIA